jgi:serine/threonine-protein kinase
MTGPGKSPPRAHVQAQQRTFGKYTLIARLAVGGMAEIFLARLEGVGGFRKQVVIKRILPHLAEDSRFVSMFLDEARIAARISHPNVCPVYELGEVDGQLFLAMEYLDGLPLSRMMRTMSRAGTVIPPVMGAAILGQACEGLHHAHKLAEPDGTPTGVIHRDVSPQNLFLTTTGTLKVLDFGVAKIRGSSARTRTGTLKGKYAYMSPEQLRGEPLDHRSDVFALGVCAFELFTSRRLFARETDFLVFKAIVEEAIPQVRHVRPDMPAELDAVVTRALSRDKERRFGSAREMGEALADAASRLGGLPSTIGLGNEMRKMFAEELEENRVFLDSAQALADADLAADGDRTLVDMDLAMKAEPTVLPAPPPSWREDDDGWSGAVAGPVAAAMMTTADAETISGHKVAPVVFPSDPTDEGTTQEEVKSETGVVPGLTGGLSWKVWAAAAVVAVVAVVVLLLLLGGDDETETVAETVAETETETAPGPAPAPAPPSPLHPSTPPPPTPAPATPSPPSVTRKEPRKPERERKPPVERVERGSFTIDSRPWATVYVDGKKLGVTPIFKKSLPAGKHTVKAVSGGKTRTFTIDISPNRELSKRLTW